RRGSTPSSSPTTSAASRACSTPSAPPGCAPRSASTTPSARSPRSSPTTSPPTRSGATSPACSRCAASAASPPTTSSPACGTPSTTSAAARRPVNSTPDSTPAACSSSSSPRPAPPRSTPTPPRSPPPPTAAPTPSPSAMRPSCPTWSAAWPRRAGRTARPDTGPGGRRPRNGEGRRRTARRCGPAGEPSGLVAAGADDLGEHGEFVVDPGLPDDPALMEQELRGSQYLHRAARRPAVAGDALVGAAEQPQRGDAQASVPVGVLGGQVQHLDPAVRERGQQVQQGLLVAVRAGGLAVPGGLAEDIALGVVGDQVEPPAVPHLLDQA